MEPWTPSPDFYRRPRTAKRVLTRAPQVSSQDVSRYKATEMPPARFDLLGPVPPPLPWRFVSIAALFLFVGVGPFAMNWGPAAKLIAGVAAIALVALVFVFNRTTGGAR